MTTAVPEIYYFGCWSESHGGHYLHDTDGRTVSNRLRRFPFLHIDGALQPENEEPCLGRGVPVSSITHKDGWTAWGFWDRTGDNRGRSNSAFIARGMFSEVTMRDYARAAFPSIWARLHREQGTLLQLTIGADTHLVSNCTECPINTPHQEQCRLTTAMVKIPYSSADLVSCSDSEVPLSCPLRSLRLSVLPPKQAKAQ